MPALAIRKGSLVWRKGRAAHIFEFPFLRKAEKPGVNTMPCRGIQPLSHGVFILNRRASSPCTVGFRVPPVADTTRKASCCRPQVRERTAEARAANGEGAESRPPSERCDFLPFRGGAAAAAEGVVIYRLPCRTVLFCAEKSASRQDSRAK